MNSKKKHERNIKINFGIVSVSTSKFEKYGKVKEIPNDDTSAKVLVKELEGFNYECYTLVPDNLYDIITAVLETSKKVCVVVTIGGTGVTPKDLTVEALKPIVKKELPGFGEIFRFESYKQIGYASILSRAFAGVLENGCVLFCLPGSENAVKLGAKIIKSVARHVVSHAKGLS